MKWVLCQNFRHIIKTKLVGKLLARLCCLLLRRGSEELLHLLGCCRNLVFDRWLEHGFRSPDSTNHQGKLFEIKGQGGNKVNRTIRCFGWCGDIRMISVSQCTRKLRENSWKTQHSMWLAERVLPSRNCEIVRVCRYLTVTGLLQECFAVLLYNYLFIRGMFIHGNREVVTSGVNSTVPNDWHTRSVFFALQEQH